MEQAVEFILGEVQENALLQGLIGETGLCFVKS